MSSNKKPGAKPQTSKVNASKASQVPNPTSSELSESKPPVAGTSPSPAPVPPVNSGDDQATTIATPAKGNEEEASRIKSEEEAEALLEKARKDKEEQDRIAEEERKAEEEKAAQLQREVAKQESSKKSILPEFLSVRMRHMNVNIRASKYYIYSTLTATQEYALWRQGGGDIQVKERSVLINGGANVANKHLVTPKGVLTIVTPEQMDILKTNKSFIRHCERGFIKVEAGAVDIDKVVSDMMSRDNSAPLIEDDYSADDAAHAPPTINRQK